MAAAAGLVGLVYRGAQCRAQLAVREFKYLGLCSQERVTSWLRECWGGVIHLPFLLQKELPPFLAPLAHLQLLVDLSNCHLCVGSQQVWWSMPVLHMWQESLPPRVLQVSLVSIMLIVKRQCNVDMFPERRSRARCVGILYYYPLLPLLPACKLGWGKGLGPNQLVLCYFTLLIMIFSSLLGIDGLFWSLQVIFWISCICCSCFLCVYVGGHFALPS